jgi:hypothetical protein
VSFYYNISSEISFDWLRWELDGKIVDGISGSMTSDSWRVATFAIPPGQHTIRWYYSKDGSNSSGLDCGFVDGILITNYANQKIVNTIPPEGTVLWSQTDHCRKK